MRKQIPNLITCMNVISGTLAIFLAMYGLLTAAAILILVGMVFDFFDGMTARLLHVKSEIGKELDSLADMVSFGVAPAILAYFLIVRELPGGDFLHFATWTLGQQITAVMPVVIAPFSAYRLAKFNLDVRQATSFIGMPTPANALFWVCLVFGKPGVLASSAFILSILLISELPMFSLKISGFGWRENKIRYCYFICLIISAGIWGKGILIFIIPLYILFSVVEALIKITTSNR